MSREGSKAFLNDPVGTLKEILELSNFQIPELLRHLKQDERIGIALISGLHDEALPHARVQKMIDEGNIDGIATITGKRGSHAEVYFDSRITKVAHEFLHNLEVKWKRRRNSD